MITIDEFMTSEPYTLRETDSLNDARQVMTEKHLRHIPITDNDNHLLGLVTQRDVLAATEPGLARAGETTVKLEAETAGIRLADIMVRNVKTALKTDSLRQAAVYLQGHKYGCLPVVSDDRLVGIITDSDFIEIAINLLEQVELSEDEVDAGEDIEMPELDEF